MTPAQRGYLWGEVYPGFAYGINRVARAMGIHPLSVPEWSPEDIHEAMKWRYFSEIEQGRDAYRRLYRAFKMFSTSYLNQQQGSEYIEFVISEAADAGILITSPEEWHRGVAGQLREQHYRWMES